jgi:hypothetical protein
MHNNNTIFRQFLFMDNKAFLDWLKDTVMLQVSKEKDAHSIIFNEGRRSLANEILQRVESVKRELEQETENE